MAKSKTNANMVLIIDDDREICESMEMAIAMEGYSVRVAQDEREALEILAVEEPGIIFLDYYGVGDSERFIAYLRDLEINAPIVLTTGAKDPQVKARALGLKYYLRKPFNVAELLKLLDNHRIAHASKVRERVAFSIFS